MLKLLCVNLSTLGYQLPKYFDGDLLCHVILLLKALEIAKRTTRQVDTTETLFPGIVFFEDFSLSLSLDSFIMI